MTFASPTPTFSTVSRRASPGGAAGQLPRKSPLASSSTRAPRRSSLSSIAKKCKIPSDKSNERFLQSMDKRRRYHRRGSKTPGMLRGNFAAFRVDLGGYNSGLDDSVHSCASTGTYATVATSASCSSSREFCLPSSCDSSSELSLSLHSPRTWDMGTAPISPPFFPTQRSAEQRKLQKEATVTLLTSALALSSIHDGSDHGSS